MGVLTNAFSLPQYRSDSAAGGQASRLAGLWESIGFGSGNAKMPLVNYKQALKLSAVTNAVDQISSSLGVIPFNVFKRTAEGRERDFSHPVDRLLRSEPDGENGFLTPFIFKKISQTSVLLRGNCLWQIKTDGGGNQKLKYIAWDDVYDIRKIKDINGDTVLVYMTKDDNLLANEVLHFKGWTFDGIIGVSVIHYASVQMGAALAMQAFSYTSFDNKGMRMGVISTDKPTTPEAKVKIKAGVQNAFAEKDPTRVVVLDEGMKFDPITVTSQEAQLIESSRFSIEDVARWFNIPLPKIKSASQSTNNNIEQQTLDYSTDTMLPHVTNFEQEIDKKLFTRAEKETHYCKGNMSVILRADLKSKGEFYSKMVNSGIYLANEVREMEEKNTLEGGNELRIPVNTQTQTQIDNNQNAE